MKGYCSAMTVGKFGLQHFACNGKQGRRIQVQGCGPVVSDRCCGLLVMLVIGVQLVGVTAMLLAAKYEEIWAPEVRDFVYISDKAYNRQQILGMVSESG